MPLTGVALCETQADADDAGVYLFCMATLRQVTGPRASSISPISQVQEKGKKMDLETLRFHYHVCICVTINKSKMKNQYIIIIIVPMTVFGKRIIYMQVTNFSVFSLQ